MRGGISVDIFLDGLVHQTLIFRNNSHYNPDFIAIVGYFVFAVPWNQCLS